MKKMYKSKMRFILIPIGGIAILFLVSYVVMLLWNHTLPDVLGTHMITLWQAMGLFFLCKLLFGFGGGRPGRGGGRWRRRAIRQKLENLSEADRERMQKYMHYKRCNWDKPSFESDKSENT